MRRFFCIGAVTALLAGGLALGPSRAQEACLDMTSRVARLLPLDLATGIGVSTVGPKYGTWGIDLSGRDLSVQPVDNFYRYANGAWDDRTQIPPDRTSFGDFAVLAILSETRTRAIIEAATAGQSNDADAAKIGAAYSAFMDEARINALDAKPLGDDLAAIRAATTHEALGVLMAQSTQGFQPAIFRLGIDSDAKNPSRYAVYLRTSGLGLPDRDYYLDASLAGKKTKYQTYIAEMLNQVGWPAPEASAKAVLDYETAIAQASWSRAEPRDVDKTYNPMHASRTHRRRAQVPLEAGPRRGGPGSHRSLHRDRQHRRFRRSRKSIPTRRSKHCRPGQRSMWSIARRPTCQSASTMSVLPSATTNWPASRNSGRGGSVRWTSSTACSAKSVGRIYVAEYFPPESKAKMEALVGDLQTALGARIQKIEWMGPQTKTRALEKLSKLTARSAIPTSGATTALIPSRPTTSVVTSRVSPRTGGTTTLNRLERARRQATNGA